MSLDQNLNKILIVDFGSQFTQLIARRIRELGIFSEIISHKKLRTKISIIQSKVLFYLVVHLMFIKSINIHLIKK